VLLSRTFKDSKEEKSETCHQVSNKFSHVFFDLFIPHYSSVNIFSRFHHDGGRWPVELCVHVEEYAFRKCHLNPLPKWGLGFI